MTTILNPDLDYGPARDEIEALIASLPGLRWFDPGPGDIECQLGQLVADHCEALAHYAPGFEVVPLRILSFVEGDAARAATWDAAWAAARDAAWAAARDAARAAARDAARAAARDAAWAAARDAARAAARAAAWDAAHLVGLPGAPNPWRPLLEMWALGAWPIGMVDGEFLVAVPEPGGKEGA